MSGCRRCYSWLPSMAAACRRRQPAARVR
ncbi:hypothetical protein CBW46_016795 [Paenibacillus xerothermodurans]|uniref:Uncharacterized protein n=1 Tax=Paenibacillus xerothermodurans TaxID=1977292 RepID=A0A2W1NY58_PAEXE|nr:hypothetical protein CBW46_016795 [Paenibacillus xerothermodurans]